MLKSLRVVVDETASDYHPVPAEWKYTDAINWLLHMAETFDDSSQLTLIERRPRLHGPAQTEIKPAP